MKKTTILLFLFTFVLTSFGQRREKDFLFLKNGNVLKGQVVPNGEQTIKLLSSGNLFVFKTVKSTAFQKKIPGLKNCRLKTIFHSKTIIFSNARRALLPEVRATTKMPLSCLMLRLITG